MTPGEVASYGQIANTLGIVGLLVVGVLAFWRGWVLTKSHYDAVVSELRAQTQFWQSQAAQERTERQQLASQLAANNERLFGMTDALADLREAVREIARSRAV